MSEPQHAHEAFYDELWSHESAALSRHERDRLAMILLLTSRLIRPNREVLDAGCGTGKLAAEVRGLGQVTAVDWSNAGLSGGHQRFPDIRFERRDLVRDDISDLEGRFGLTICSEVLEHVGRENRACLVSRLAATLVSGGSLVLTTPNASIARSIGGLGALYQPENGLLEPEETLTLLRSAGFRVLQTCSATFFESAWERSPLFRRVRGALPGRRSGNDALDRLLRGTRQGLYFGCLARKA